MTGLSAKEASRRLKQYGPNAIADHKSLPGIKAFFSRFQNPLVIILLLAAALSASLGDVVSFTIIVCIVTISVVLDFVNSYRSERAAQALQARVRVTAEVLRDDAWVKLPLAEIVPGDVVKLAAGKLVPADGSLIDGKDLYVNESTLTGESFPQQKSHGRPLYLGSSVVSGTGQMLVEATGKTTKFSHIAAAVEATENETEFDHEIRDLSLLIVRLTSALVVFIFAFNAVFKHNLLESLLFSLALAVGLTPELLPLIITLNLTKGSLAMARHGVIVKRISAIQSLGSMDVLCTDKTGTLTEDRIELVRYVDGLGGQSQEVLFYSYLTCVYSTAFENPLDRAIKAFRHLDTSGYTKIDEIPFDFERKRESVVAKHRLGLLLITKGAPEEVMRLSTTYHDGKTLTVRVAKRIREEYESLSADGFRVLAVATREMGRKENYEPSDERELTFQGFIAFLDPAKKSVTSTLEKMAQYGVGVKIITGDNALVSQRIAADINLPVHGVVTGPELEKLNHVRMAQAVEANTIFARVTPEQKMHIIQLLQKNGHVVGYMGDGINDAPSLHAADIGISVNNAVDVAKGTADLILLHKSLGELIEGVIEGRKTFANTLKYLKMSLSSNFGNMFSMAGASIFLPFLPMLATQILFNNLLYDSSQFAIPLDNVDEEQVEQPHTLSISGIKHFMLVFGPLSSIFDFTTFGVLLLVFHFGEHAFQTGWFIESMLTQIFVVYIIRTKQIPFLQSRPSKALMASTLLAATIAVAVIYSPLAKYLHFTPLSALAMGSIAGIVLVYLIAAEVVKRAFYQRIGI